MPCLLMQYLLTDCQLSKVRWEEIGTVALRDKLAFKRALFRRKPLIISS